MGTTLDDATLDALLSASATDGHDDAAALWDALAQLEDCAHEDHGLTSKRARTSKATSAASSTTGRRRIEIAQLRAEMDELEATKCAFLKRRREELKVVPDQLSGAWESIAARQRELRDQATTENARLKCALDEMVRQRDALACLLRRERARKAREAADKGARNSYAAVPVYHPARGLKAHNVLCDELMGSLPQQYLDTPRALLLTKTSPSYHPLRSSEYARITPLRTIESFSHVIYPFNYADTVPEVWTALSGVADDQPGIAFSSVEMREDSFRLEIKIDIQYQRKRAEFHLTTVAKRIVEPNRTVIVWTGLAVPRGVGDVSMEGISIRQRGWSVVEPLSSSELATGSTPAATRLSMYFEDVILVEESVEKKSSKIKMLQQYLLNIYKLEGGARRQKTENKLFDRAMAQVTVK